MNDGKAHPKDPDLCRYDSTASWGPMDVPSVAHHHLGDEHRAAIDLETIVDRFYDGLPAHDSAMAKQILEAAQFLYIELYRDCGPEARRQKLKGARLLWRWLEKTIVPKRVTSEEKKRCRAFMVADCVDLGISPSRAYEIAASVAATRGLDLGKKSSFAAAFKEYREGADWVNSSMETGLHEPVAESEILAYRSQSVESRERAARRDEHLLAAASAMPDYWAVEAMVRTLKERAGYLVRHTRDGHPHIDELLRLKVWEKQIFEALKVDSSLPSSSRLRQLCKKSKRSQDDS